MDLVIIALGYSPTVKKCYQKDDTFARGLIYMNGKLAGERMNRLHNFCPRLLPWNLLCRA